MNVRWPSPERSANMGTSMPTVLIVDDDSRIRQAARLLLESTAFEIVGEGSSVDEARAALHSARPDVILLDLGLPDGSGIEVLELTRSATNRPVVIVLTVFDDDAHIFDALRAGAVGYLLKDEIVHRLVASVTEALEGGAPMSPSVARRVLQSFHQPAAGPAEEELTPRERDVVELIARGSTYIEVGRMLGVSTNTVRSHIRRAYEKLHVSSKTEATREALRRGIVKL